MRVALVVLPIVWVLGAGCGASAGDATGQSLSSVPTIVTSTVETSSSAPTPPTTLPSVTTTATVASTTPMSTTSAPPVASSAPPTPVTPLDLSQVPPVSVAMAISWHLTEIVQWVRSVVGPDIYAGAAINGDSTDDVTMQIFGTDVDAIEAALATVDSEWLDRFTVIESTYSERATEQLSADVTARLAEAGIEGWAWIPPGSDLFEVDLVTPDGQPDPELEARAVEVLQGLPVTIAFTGPAVPFVAVP